VKIDDIEVWVEQARLRGKIEDECVGLLVNEAMDFCWALYDQERATRTATAENGIRWVATLMVAATQSDGDVLPFIWQRSRVRRALIFREAVKHGRGQLQKMLLEIVNVTDEESDRVMIEIGVKFLGSGDVKRSTWAELLKKFLPRAG